MITTADSGLPVMEQFYTVQGEGAHTGTAAYFIRLAGCNVGCVWCDVKDSWNANDYPSEKICHLSQQAKATGTEIVVITGGEPCIYPLHSLTSSLRKMDLRTHLETSGAYDISGDWHWICLSPKKFKPPLPSALQKADELKVVVYNRHDFAWAETHALNVRQDCQLYLQPEWTRADQMMPLIVAYVKDHPKWKISLQTHKFLDIP